MSVTVNDTVLGRTIVARCGGQLVGCAVEHDDYWQLAAGDDLPYLRVESFDTAHAWLTYLDRLAERTPDGTGDVVAIRGTSIHFLLGMFRSNDDVPAVIRVWIDPLDKAAKVKIGSGTWSPPLGEIEVAV